MPTEPRTPDFIRHPWRSLAGASLHDGFVTLTWPDGTTYEAFSLWLAENAEGYGLEPTVRESILEPTDLPAPNDLCAATVGDDGALELTWSDRPTVRVHPGWLRHIADGGHRPASSVPSPTPWTATDMPDPPTIDGSGILDDPAVMERWLALMVEFGLCRLEHTPTDHSFVGELVGRVGPIRDTNFGPVWSVRASVEPDSTANTGLDLGQHTDLPTRETPPGFQFLHCVENSVAGGWSRMSDGLSVVEAIRAEHADTYEALTTLDWVFANRSPDAEHRWIGPLIDHGSRHQPLTLRAFYPVRCAPHMPATEVPRAYAALRVFAHVARDDRFQIRYPFRPGDLVGFDNRRMLHGRDSFEGGGRRHLRGCYADHDDVHARLRVLRRPSAPNGSTSTHQSLENTTP